jgi:hypothetical protein
MLDLDRELQGLVARPARAPEPIGAIQRRAQRRRRRRRLALAVVAVLTALVVASASAVLSRAGGHPNVAVSTNPPDPLAGLTPGWHVLGAIPPAALSPDQAVWTGQRLIIWHAGTNSMVDFDPVTGQHQRVAASPLRPRANVVMAWTGREVLVWGGYPAPPGQPFYENGDDLSGAGAATPFVDGAAYNPSTQKWRRLPSAPITPRLALGAVWTGKEFIVSGGPPRTQGRSQTPKQVATDGAAYNPTTNTWRHIPAAPISVTEGVVRWSGHEMLVFGSLRTDFPNSCRIDTTGATPPCTITDANGALYDPATNQWRKLPTSTVPGVGPTAAFADQEILATAGVLNPQRYPLNSSSWQDATGLHATPQEACYTTLTGGGNLALLSNCGNSYAIFNPTTNTWANIANPPVPFDQQPWGDPLWTGHAFLYWHTNPWLPGTAAVNDPTQKDLNVWAYVP